MPEDDDSAAQVEQIERSLLGARHTLTRRQVAEKSGVPLELAEELWAQLGFPHAADDDVAFTKQDVTALKLTNDLISLGILAPDSQAALVRTWGRSFARLAEWQVSLLAGIAIEEDDPAEKLDELMGAVMPNIEKLQSYIWRRHLASAASRLLGTADLGTLGATSAMAVCFVDIVGYTGQSKNLSEQELVDWLEYFEDEMTRSIVAIGGRVIKTIGDEVLFVADDPQAAAEIALILTQRGADEEDRFPQVRAGIAYGEVVSRLGDVLGPTVNIASRLTSVARPDRVLVDRGAYDALSAAHQEGEPDPETGEIPVKLLKILDKAADELADLSPYTEAGEYRFRRLPRKSVKGYARLEPYLLRRAKSSANRH